MQAYVCNVICSYVLGLKLIRSLRFDRQIFLMITLVTGRMIWFERWHIRTAQLQGNECTCFTREKLHLCKPHTRLLSDL